MKTESIPLDFQPYTYDQLYTANCFDCVIIHHINLLISAFKEYYTKDRKCFCDSSSTSVFIQCFQDFIWLLFCWLLMNL